MQCMNFFLQIKQELYVSTTKMTYFSAHKNTVLRSTPILNSSMTTWAHTVRKVLKKLVAYLIVNYIKRRLANFHIFGKPPFSINLMKYNFFLAVWYARCKYVSPNHSALHFTLGIGARPCLSHPVPRTCIQLSVVHFTLVNMYQIYDFSTFSLLYKLIYLQKSRNKQLVVDPCKNSQWKLSGVRNVSLAL